MESISAIQPLTQLQREQARENARKALLRKIGHPPAPEQYMKAQISRYPGWMQGIIAGLCIVVLIAAFVPSSIRLYYAGVDAFATGVRDTSAAVAVGIATIFLAEAAQLVFSLALAAWQHRALWLGVCISTAIAFAGNITIAQPTYEFAWLEAIAPPLLVVLTAYILKEQWLHSIEQRHAGKIAFEHALQGWQEATRDLSDHRDWPNAYAGALLDMLRSRRKLHAIPHADLLRLVQRELQSEDVIAGIDALQNKRAVKVLPVRMHHAQNAGQETNEVSKALKHADDGPTHVACPHCTWEKDYENKRSARFALTAHLRKHPEKQTTVRVNGHVEAISA